MNFRRKLVAVLCRLFRHPDRTEVSADGWSRTACRCGWISFSIRSFRP